MQRCAAVIGKRDVSPLAAGKTEDIVRTFTSQGFGILSGLAIGIDTLAHTAAIHQGAYTVAVLPKPLNYIYPPENNLLASSIMHHGGALISEQAPAYSSVANSFVLRNRIQAALSDYVIPVEMGLKSGTQYTIQYAVRYGRKIIFCLPDVMEIDHFLPYYEGIIADVKKYKSKADASIIVIKGLKCISEVLNTETANRQFNLFDG